MHGEDRAAAGRSVTMTEPVTDLETRQPRRRRAGLAAALVAVLAAAAVLDLAHPLGSSPGQPFGHAHPANTSGSDASDGTSTSTVTRRTLLSQVTDDATLGYADSYTVINQLGGAGSGSAGTGQGSAPAGGAGTGGGQSGRRDVVTELPKPGQVIRQGQVLYRVDGEPVVLLYGSTPAFGSLSEGVTNSDNVRQLNADLVALGYASRSELDPSSDEFGAATTDAVEKLQDHLGVDQTGELDFGDVVFLPTAIRVSTVSATLAGSLSAGNPVLSGTSTSRQVTVDVDTGEQSEVKVGDQVTVTLPNNQTTPGVVESMGTIASSASGSAGGTQPNGSADTGSGGGSSSGSGGSSSSGSGSSSDSTVEVDVRLIHPSTARVWDQAPVQVTITADTVRDVLVVPVVALLAQAGGGYAVEVVDGDGTRHLVPVSLGLFDDAHGLVQVTGTGLTVGQRVVVPKL
jgi:hypothetical protein